ncbi:hypothetical protein GGR51DRAFT_561311 [Nemania sp. FL0031]|nr:hypothetical protein GGR51DRAFT_561311 [Nemania sp. FL0031]
MCRQIQNATYSCAHQYNFYWSKARFCLFTGEGQSRFHLAYVMHDFLDQICPRCEIGEKIKQNGGVKKGVKLRQAIEERYAATADYEQEQCGKRFVSESNKALAKLTTLKQIEELQLQIKERIVFYLDRVNVTPYSKTILLETVLSLPDMFKVPEVLTFFASWYFGKKDDEKKDEKKDDKRQFQQWERKRVFSLVHGARLDRTFKAGLKLLEPMELPVRNVPSASEGSAPQSEQEQIEEGIEKISLSTDEEGVDKKDWQTVPSRRRQKV